MKDKKAVVLLSGGLDSATVLFLAKRNGYQCHCLIFDYRQRHRREIQAAKQLAQHAGSPFYIIKIALPWGGSALVDANKPIPEQRRRASQKIPSTYVPARNTIFLSFALSCAEAMGASALFIGAHIQDYSGYPDCRPRYFEAFRNVIAYGTKAGTTGRKIRIETPLLHKSKKDIIKLGVRLRLPFELTWSCYRGGRRPCGRCDSCRYRAQGFRQAGIKDPLYA